MAEATADEVIDVRAWLPKDAYVEAAVVIVQYSMPGLEDRDDRGPWLATRRDSFHGAWNHLGMLEAFAGDIRAVMVEPECNRGHEGDSHDE